MAVSGIRVPRSPIIGKRALTAHHGLRGVTLVELLIVVAVIAVLAGIAVPNLGPFVRNIRVNSVASALATDLSYARSEAVKRNARIYVCAKNPAADACDGEMGTPITWTTGWLVCHDADGVDVCEEGVSSATDPNPIRVGNATAGGIVLDGDTGMVVFTPLGAATAAASFDVTLDAAAARRVTVAATGNVRVFSP